MNSLGLIFDIIGVLILFTMDLKMIGLDADAIPMTKDPVKVKKEKINKKAYRFDGIAGYVR